MVNLIKCLITMYELDVLYDSLKNRITIERDTFKQIFSTWNVTGLYEQDVLIGCVVQKNHEVHIGYKQKPTVSIRKHLKNTLKKVLNDYGFATTSVMKNNMNGLNFCKRLGFYEISQDESKINLKCDRCKYVD